jgi:deoxyribodipyrimidine photo-lyase
LNQDQEPTRAAGLRRLDGFVSRAGRDYAAQRNYDLGPGRHGHVSGLSPYIRHRLVTEEDVVRRVLDRHAPSSAEKFLQEVFWRTYWKGWLERRPSVWADYLRAVDTEKSRLADEAPARRDFLRAMEGRTGIACFDAWVDELDRTGYLHNHARMWFASIWIFTLRLPWTLGADLFMSKLLDGDPASNTLSWRWVAGLQTRGKTYLARADNIERYTDGRFRPDAGSLATTAIALDEPAPPAPLPSPQPRPMPQSQRIGVLVHEEDLSPEWLIQRAQARHVAVLHRAADRTGPSDRVARFKAGALSDAATRLTDLGLEVDVIGASEDGFRDPLAWASARDLTAIVTPYAPVGPTRRDLDGHHRILSEAGIALVPMLRAWDADAWPYATKGFFPFKQHIPKLLARLTA